jgi:large subunit ribosomal protein L25
MKSVALNAYPRSVVRRIKLKQIRANGRIPAVIYGRESKPQNLEVERKHLEHLMHHSVSETKLVDLSIAGDERTNRLALLQEVQHHPLSGQVLHVDFHEVSEKEKVTVPVPVETIGESVGVKTGGGILEHVLFKLRVRALPKDLPEFIQIDVSHLEVGQTIHVGDIQAEEGVEILGEKTISVVSVAAPREVAEGTEETEAAPGLAAGQVEMIKERKEEPGKPAEKGGKAEDKAEKSAEKSEKKK